MRLREDAHPLRGDRLVNGKLLDVGWPLRLHSCCRHSFRDPHGEGVEVLARLPEVDDPPATIDRPGCVEDEPLRRRAIGVDAIVTEVELLLSDPRQLDADTDSHHGLSFRRERDPTPFDSRRAGTRLMTRRRDQAGVPARRAEAKTAMAPTSDAVP